MIKKEKPSEWYDSVYESGGNDGMYHLPVPKFPLYSLFLSAFGRICLENPVIDIGCGVGMFADVCNNFLHEYKAGYDFSKRAIEMAQKKYDGINFVHAEIKEIPIESFDTKSVICIFEVLEHLENDLELIERINPGTQILFSVPNFDSESHVRFFEDVKSVIDRYEYCLEFTFMETFRFGDTSKIFLFEAIKK